MILWQSVGAEGGLNKYQRDGAVGVAESSAPRLIAKRWADKGDAASRTQLRTRRFDQFSTLRSEKREKSVVLTVTSTSLLAWAIAAICPST